MATQLDIARITGTSVPTVSRVLSGKADSCGIGKDVADRVLDAAAKLKYKVNRTAQSLRTGRHNAIGVLFYSTMEPIYGQLVPEIVSALHNRGYSAICGFWSTKEEAAQSISSVAGQGIDGIITCHNPKYVPEGIPAVFFSEKAPGKDAVFADGAKSLLDAASHLYGLGHRRIASFGIGKSLFEAARLPSLELSEYGIDYSKIHDPGPGAIADAVSRLLSCGKEERPTAIICRNDLVAMRTVSALSQAGCTVPGDFSVVGFDATALGKWFHPSITSFGAPIEKLAALLADTLLWRMANPGEEAKRIPVKRELSQGSSTAPVHLCQD